jgi:hypothetical protein
MNCFPVVVVSQTTPLSAADPMRWNTTQTHQQSTKYTHAHAFEKQRHAQFLEQLQQPGRGVRSLMAESMVQCAPHSSRNGSAALVKISNIKIPSVFGRNLQRELVRKVDD